MRIVQHQVFWEGVWWVDVPWESRQNHVFELDGVVWQRVYKIEVEVAQKVTVVLQDYQHYSQGRGVETLHRGRRWNAWDHIVFEEPKALNEQLFKLVPEDVLWGWSGGTALTRNLLWLNISRLGFFVNFLPGLMLNKMRHKELVWN